MKSSALQWHIHWPTTLFALVLLPVLLALGNWQLQRAEAKRVAQAALESARVEAPVNLVELADQPAAYTRVSVRGHYDNTQNFLLDNRIHNGRFGYEVVTVFVPEQSDLKLLVDRGWVEGDPARRKRPQIATIDGDVTIVGAVYRDTGKFDFVKTVHETQWPKLIQNLRTDDLQVQLGAPIFPFVLRLDADAPGAYVTDWRIFNAGFGPERHTAYAVTWFAMAITLVAVWLLISSNLWLLIRGAKVDD